MKQLKVLLTAVVWLTYSNKLSAQIIPVWATAYACNYPVFINQNDMATDKNGNVYITGYTNDTSFNNVNAITLKYNSSGQFQWAQYYDSIGYYTKIAIDDFGNSYISGLSSKGLLIIKYNTQGVLQWNKFYSNGNWALDIITDNLSNVYMVGLSNGNRHTTLKYNASGTLLWAAVDSILNGTGYSNIALDNAKNVYVTVRGDTTGYASTSNIIKYNSAGIKKWESIYKSNFSLGLSAPTDIKYHPSGFIYLLSNSTNNNNGDGDYVVVKYDTLGNQLWSLPYSFTSYYDVPKSMGVDKAGNVYVTGNIYPTGGTLDSIATIKISKSGVFKWKRTYSFGFSNLDEASGIAVDSLGFIYVTGQSGGQAYKQNCVTLKYDSLGNQVWVGRYQNTLYSHDIANSISLDKFANVYVSGTTGDGNSSGILTIKYSNAVGIQELTNNSNGIINVYPNPFDNFFIIKSNKNLSDAVLTLYDAFGKEVLKTHNINNENIIVQRNNLADGIYFFTLLENNQIIDKGKVIAN